MRTAYLDCNATAPLRPEAREAMLAAMSQTGNASSVHRFGRAARSLIEDARAAVAELVGVQPVQVVFTSGGTEANATALRGMRRPVLASAGEHVSVLEAAPMTPVSLRADGIIDLEALEHALAEAETAPALAVMLANNETGVIQPVAQAARLAREHGALLHCDAVQAAGKIPVDVASLGAASLSLSAHKLGGPQGTGALILADSVEIAPLLRGGGQERRRRAGTENVAAIAGFGAAARAAQRDLAKMQTVARLRDDLESELRAREPELVIHGAEAPRLPNTSCFGVPGVSAETLVMALDLAGVAVGAGSACSSGKVAPSHVLRALGASDSQAREAIRVSLGWASTAEDTAQFLAVWEACLKRRRAPRAESSAGLAMAGHID
jgi:cysteine desulfurase